MAKDPAFLFYSQDFYTGTATMSFEDKGKYITILCLMHQQGRMSEETIRFLVGSVSVNLKNKFMIDSNGLWYNERLEEEAEKRRKFTESRRENGLQGGRPKKEEKPLAKHKVNLMEDENENVNVKKKFKIPDIAEVKKFFLDNGYSEVVAEKVWHYYNDGNWHDSEGKPVKSWKQKMRGVWFKEENKKKGKQLSI